MIIEIVGERGLVEPPIRMRATQIVIRQDNGTVISIAAELAEGTQLVSHAGNKDFNEALARLGIKDRTTTSELLLPPSFSGAQLLSSPDKGG